MTSAIQKFISFYIYISFQYTNTLNLQVWHLYFLKLSNLIVQHYTWTAIKNYVEYNNIILNYDYFLKQRMLKVSVEFKEWSG